MLETVFRTEDVPPADRFDYWREFLSATHAPMELSSEYAGDFRAWQRNLHLGEVTVWPTSFQPLVLHRTPKLIRQSDPEAFHLSLILNGTGTADWGDRRAAYAPYDLHVQDTSRACTIRAVGGGSMLRCVGVEIPRRLLPLPDGLAGRLVGGGLTGRSGFGGLLTGFLLQLARNTGAYGPADGPRLGGVLVDLVGAMFAHVLDAERALAPETRTRTLLMRIRAYIAEHLHDPDLTPAAVAAAHHISRSYLHRLFRAEGVSVATWIRMQRLERARRDLADPRMAAVPVHQIAARWGFTYHSAFTRAFRTAYGTAPSEYRRETLGGAAA
ncbi:helix-turn-helix domain-containing protein [Actinomadura keratinilytica]|uniref:Helix-turn-helix domain-containing protein n=1 Tax=Actinomadura keratinilytica TaxID=547461 RepID=A0ABP7ZEB6_9ACTN